MRVETNTGEAEVASWMRSVGTLATTTPLPDPDVLWLRAQIAARQEAAARALWMSTLRQVLRYGAVCAGAAWLMLDSVARQESALAIWEELRAALPADPVQNVAISSVVALATALVVGGLILGRSLVSRRLRDLGLL